MNVFQEAMINRLKKAIEQETGLKITVASKRKGESKQFFFFNTRRPHEFDWDWLKSFNTKFSGYFIVNASCKDMYLSRHSIAVHKSLIGFN